MAHVEGVSVETAALNAGNTHQSKSNKSTLITEAEELSGAEAPAVQISLSEEASELLSEPAEVTGPGKSQQSTAHRARAALELEEFAALRDLPFGKIVSTLAHNGDLSSLLPEPAAADSVDESEFVETSEAVGATVVSDEVNYASQEISEAELALELLNQAVAAEE